MQTPTLLAAFLFGLVSFLSPCVFPLIPAYIGYLSGSTVMGAVASRGAINRAPTLGGTATMAATTAAMRWRVLLHAFLFVLGFTFVFVVVIGGLAGLLSEVLRENKRWVQYITGVMLVIFGLHMIGIINIRFLDYTRRMDIRPSTNLGYLRSLLIGFGFGAGWTPCIGGPLTAMFTMAVNDRQAEAFPLFLAYSLGLGIPFLLAALAMGQISTGLKKLTRRTFTFNLGNWTVIDRANVVSVVSGVLLIVMGYLVFTNALAILGTFAPPININIQ